MLGRDWSRFVLDHWLFHHLGHFFDQGDGLFYDHLDWLLDYLVNDFYDFDWLLNDFVSVLDNLGGLFNDFLDLFDDLYRFFNNLRFSRDFDYFLDLLVDNLLNFIRFVNIFDDFFGDFYDFFNLLDLDYLYGNLYNFVFIDDFLDNLRLLARNWYNVWHRSQLFEP